MASKKDDNSKLVSILSYLLIGIIWYFADKSVQNAETKFHSKQALNLIIVSFALSFILHFLFEIMFFLALLVSPIFMLLHLAIFVFWILGLINAIQGNKKEIPIIGQYANKYLNY